MAEVSITQHTLKGLEVKTAGVHYNINAGILYNMLRDNLLSRQCQEIYIAFSVVVPVWDHCKKKYYVFVHLLMTQGDRINP